MRSTPQSDRDRIARQLDWNLLRTFVVIVQEAGITSAARRLGRQQPTVSNALRRLERTLDKRLIDRGPAHFRVTRAGQRLYQEALEIYGSVSRLAVAIGGIEDRITGHVRLAMASHVICPMFDEALAQFNAENPAATLEIDVTTSSAVVQSVLEKQASLGICLVQTRHPKLAYEVMYREYFGYFCGPRHRYFGVRDLTMADLQGEPSVSFKTDALTDVLRPVALLREQARLGDAIIGTSSNLEEVRRMIIAGLGVGPLPVHVAAADVRDRLLWRLPPYDDPPAIDVFLIWNPATRLNRAEDLFLGALRARIAATPLAQRTFHGRSPTARPAPHSTA